MPVVAIEPHEPLSTWEDWRPALDRCLLMSWLLKDLGWMTTNVYLAWPFGFISILLHFLVLVIDWPSSVANRFYHTSLVLWIIGNFLWMSVEFMVTPQSSSIHLGPDTPLGGMTSKTGDKLTNIKSKLFLIAIFLQLTLFACIRLNVIQMPVDDDSELDEEEEQAGQWYDEDEEMVRRIEEAYYMKEASIEGGSNKSSVQPGKDETPDGLELGSMNNGNAMNGHRSPEADSKSLTPSKPVHSRSVSASSIDDASVLDSFRHFIPTTKKYPLGFSLTFIENGYIILWICKDYFWSWATGDFNINRKAGYATEFVSMFFGVLSVCLYTFVAYAWRHNFVNLMDSLTSWCWLFSNFTWMSGEIFIRYDNMELNDDNQGDDGLTRLVSGIFFIVGINVQVCVLCHFILEKYNRSSRDTYRDSRSGSISSMSSSEHTNVTSMGSEADLPSKWSNIEISGQESRNRLPKLSLGFLPKINSNNHKFVNIQSMDVDS